MDVTGTGDAAYVKRTWVARYSRETATEKRHYVIRFTFSVLGFMFYLSFSGANICVNWLTSAISSMFMIAFPALSA